MQTSVAWPVGRAHAVAEDRLRRLERGAAEFDDAGADLDSAGPVQLLQVIDLHAHHHKVTPGTPMLRSGSRNIATRPLSK